MIKRFRAQHPECQSLTGSLGNEPSRQPPSDATILKLRQQVGKVLGVPAEAADAHHECSPWRHELFKAVLQRTQDSDVAVAEWLKEPPFGIERGLFRPRPA